MLNQTDAEILFPIRILPDLRDLRGSAWQALVERVMTQPEDSLDSQAFTLMMIRLDGCLTCHANSHRAMLGCTQCATQRIARYKGSDRDLLATFDAALADITAWHTDGIVPDSERPPTEVES